MMQSPHAVTDHAIWNFLDLCALGGPVGPKGACGPHPPRLPLVDVRSPEEFRQGHIPGAANLPLFSDMERADVGICYKHQGKHEAVMRGFAHVGPKMESLARRAAHLAGPDKELALYCSRGGMRSASLAWLFTMAGLRVHVLTGGYKAFRRYVLDFYRRVAEERTYRLFVLGGKTGGGKTEVLHLMAARGAQTLDLEAMANHRGSAFGALPGTSQPTGEQFENLLAIALAQCDPKFPVWVEDESENLGTVNQPRDFFHCLRLSPLAVVETPFEARLARVLAGYGSLPPEFVSQSTDRIRKRLGGLEYKKARAALAANDLPALARILLAYYDRAYEKQLHSRAPFVRIQAHDLACAADHLMDAALRRERGEILI